MTIEQMSCTFYRIPLERELGDSTHRAISHFELVIVRVADDDGASGLGYTYAVNSAGAAIRVLIDEYLRPVVIGRDPDETEAIWTDMWWKVHHNGRGGPSSAAISAIDIAIWDLRARRAHLPLWRFLGGYNPRVPVYAGGIDLAFSVTELLDQADQFQEAGFRAIKMKVGRASLADDVDRVSRMRQYLGDDFPLMADANMKWTADEAIRAAHALEDFNLVWLEEPIIPDDLVGHARLARLGRVPIATGENLHTLYEFQQMLELGGVTYPEPDVTCCGGVTTFRKIAALAEGRNLPVTSHGAHDITVHLLAAAPNRTYMEIHGFDLNRFLRDPLVISDGFTVASERHGHGVELDFDGLEPYRADQTLVS